MKIINPATEKMICEVKEDTKDEIVLKYKKLKEGQKLWKKEKITKRIAAIEVFCGLLEKNCEELALELTREMGKPINEARGEISGAIKKMQFFIKESASFLETKLVNTDGNTEEVLSYDPLGVIANISAWNYPYLVGVNIFVPALMTGNAVLYKPSEYSTLVGKSIEKHLHSAGIPEDVFQMVCGGGDVGREILNLPLDGHFFTGSYKTGKSIAVEVAHKLSPMGLELGGKDPVYITEDVDVEGSAKSIVEGVFYNNGQSCCSVERVYVHQNVYDDFIKYFLEETRALVLGDPELEETQMGALTMGGHLDFLDALVKDAISKGAKLLCGGKRLSREGYFYEPTVFVDVDHQMDLMKIETFGPVIGIQKVRDDDEAISLMNDSEFGLTSAVFTRNRKRGEKILGEVETGTGYLNCCDRVSGYLPWSGRKHSGFGSALSKHGLYAFCNPKGLHIRM